MHLTYSTGKCKVDFRSCFLLMADLRVFANREKCVFKTVHSYEKLIFYQMIVIPRWASWTVDNR